MTLAILAAAAIMTAKFFYERRRPLLPLKARAARSTLNNALRGRR
ncbi:MAG: hypothetical protein Q8T11_08865 [Elusimicrobiota bacterium]|nr:hypothetical protein [Elusimicrobiota bacterium]